MPWRATSVMEQRIEFVVRAITQEGTNFSQLCQDYGISRRTGYKWFRRYMETGSFSQLQELSRRPHNSPTKTSSLDEARVLELRQRYGWGGKKINELLKQQALELSVSTINRIIKRNGLVRAEDMRRQATKRFERQRANELWQMDFKGEFRMDCNKCCYPLSIIDDHSRFALGVFGLADKALESVSKCLISAFEKYGLPEGMLIGHGSPWWSTTNGHGLTKLSVSLIKQGIKLYYSGIRHPQTRGKVERFHRTLEEAIRHKGKPQSFSDWDRVFDEFLYEYNYIRPHEALGMDVPANRYSASCRQYNPNPKEWEYSEGSIVITLNSSGVINWQGRYYFVCEALCGERVGVQVVDELVLVSFRNMYIREINTLTGRTIALVLPVS